MERTTSVALTLALLGFVDVSPAAGQAACESPTAPSWTATDTGLVVSLDRDRRAELAPVIPDVEVLYEYLGYLAPIQHHIVKATYWDGEGWNHFLIDHCTGAQFILKEPPAISPSGLHLAMASVDLDAEYAPTVLQVWTRGPEGFFLVWDYEPLEDLSPGERPWGPSRVSWDDEVTLRFDAVNDRELEVPGGVVRQLNDGWQMTRDPVP